MERQDTVYRRYPLSDTSLPARYARAIATYRHGDLQQRAGPDRRADPGAARTIPISTSCAARRCWKAASRPRRSRRCARRSQLSNNAPLIEMLLGQALVATDNKAYTDEAIAILRAAVARETEAPLGYTPARHGLRPEGRLCGGRSRLRPGRLSARRQQDRARSRLARQDPFCRSARPDGSRPTISSPPSRCPVEERSQI